MPSKIVIGIEPWLSMALEDWSIAEPLVKLVPIAVEIDKNYLFKFPNLNDYSPNESSVFVAWGAEFLNFQRLELFGEFKKRGFKMPPLIHPTSLVSSSAKIQENVWLHAFTSIGSNSIIEYNSCISFSSKVFNNVIVQRNSWVGERVIIQQGARIGANSILGNSINVLCNVNVGRQVRIEITGTIDKDITDKSFHIQASGLCGRIIRI